tara:strand:+ start:285 stop:404 length:120 start_codon:yes stop_codon:yes gene_type:complete
MDIKLLGDLLIMFGIISSGILFIVVNLNYSPGKDKEREE